MNGKTDRCGQTKSDGLDPTAYGIPGQGTNRRNHEIKEIGQHVCKEAWTVRVARPPDFEEGHDNPVREDRSDQ